MFLFSENTVRWLGWAVLGLGFLISLPFCYIANRFLYFGCIMIALPAGVSLALVLQASVIYIVSSEYALFIVIGALCLVFTVLCLMFTDLAINIANAITSSYVIMRCIGLIMDYPYEFVMYFERNVYKT